MLKLRRRQLFQCNSQCQPLRSKWLNSNRWWCSSQANRWCNSQWLSRWELRCSILIKLRRCRCKWVHSQLPISTCHNKWWANNSQVWCRCNNNQVMLSLRWCSSSNNRKWWPHNSTCKLKWPRCSSNNNKCHNSNKVSSFKVVTTLDSPNNSLPLRRLNKHPQSFRISDFNHSINTRKSTPIKLLTTSSINTRILANILDQRLKMV